MLQTEPTANRPQAATNNEGDYHECVRALNDRFRRNPEEGLGISGRLVFTEGLVNRCDRWRVLQRVRTYNRFDGGNDPHGEHDFGTIDEGGERILWKIDYYSRDLKHASPDASNASVTCRVLTIMLAEEY